MDKRRFDAGGKSATLYMADSENRPLIVLNNYAGDGEAVMAAVSRFEHVDFNLLNVDGLDWNHDMTPWECPPAVKGDTPFTGGADTYLALLTDEIIPKAQEMVKGIPVFVGIAGYSLAGLFSLYAVHQCDVFDCVASMSGSLWFPDFKEYIFSHSMTRRPDKMYFSLGDTEAKTRNEVLKTVRDNTEEIVRYYKEAGLNVVYELNPGNHFKDEEIRSAKGIMALLRQ